MSQDVFTPASQALFAAVLDTYSDNLQPSDAGDIVCEVHWKTETEARFSAILEEHFGETALVERVLELQGDLAMARERLRVLQGEQALFPDQVAAHA